MKNNAYQNLIDVLNENILPININQSEKNQYASLLDKIGDARFVLMGEATHGTHEFYQARIEISQELIQKKNFMAIAIEGDWPDVYTMHRYIQGKGDQENHEKALKDFKRFPIWMWRNKTLPPFLYWLRNLNDQLPPENKIGFYGLDLYSLSSSMKAVINYLNKIDPEAAKRAQSRYACFDHMNGDPQTYGYLTSSGMKKSCVKEAVEQLIELQHHAFDYIKKDQLSSAEDYFYNMQNAKIVKNAENYYRTMFEGRVSSWNVRDTHMTETLTLIADHLENRFQKPAKIIVWAHNSHVGDARATEMGEHGEVNIGQLTREQHDADTFLLGFSTDHGSVTAASKWDGAHETKRVQPGLTGSYEELFHQLRYKNFLLDLHSNPQLEHYLHIPRLQRAIGVVYRPDTERESHYFFTRLPYQFDSIIHFDHTHAVEPLAASKKLLVEEP